MGEVNLTGTVTVDTATVGSVTGTIVDTETGDYAVVGVKQYQVIVYVDTAQVGSGILVFEDKYADPAAAGQRTVTATGTVSIDASAVGQVSVELTDAYGQAPLPDVGFIRYTARVIAQAGGTVAIEVTLQNQTSQDATVTITVTDENGATVASTTTTVPAGGQQTVTLNAQAPATPGTYRWTLTVTAG